MGHNKKELLNEMILIEKNMALLYELYAELFKKDTGFWQAISSEEVRHAIVLDTGNLYMAIEKLPDEALYKDLDSLKLVNKSINQAIAGYRKLPPPIEDAYNFAIQMEKCAAEAYYQKLMEKNHAHETIKVWQQLNGDSVGHADRIRALLEEKKGL